MNRVEKSSMLLEKNVTNKIKRDENFQSLNPKSSLHCCDR